MQPLHFKVLGWHAWKESAPALPLTTPSALRRRLSPLAQQTLQAAWQLPGAANARIVLSSRHGDFARTLTTFEAMVRDDAPSPADFTLMVHHALTGLLSIAQQNRQGHTALAGGRESFCYGLLEALTCLNAAPATPVLLLHYDAPLPAPFDRLDPHPAAPIAFAALLGAEGADCQFTCAPRTEDEAPSASHVEDFIRFLESPSATLRSPGERLCWQWSRHAANP